MITIEDKEIDAFFGTYERPVRWERKKAPVFERSMSKMAVQKDCFAYRIGGCSIMTETICRHDTCSFYKTREQMAKDREKYGYIKNYRPKGDAR